MDDEAGFEEKEEILTKRAAQERLNISKLTREDLEDKYLTCYDENILLKKHGRKQEEKIKKMATKLIRLIQDKKKVNPPGSNQNKPPMRDIDQEELINNLQIRLSDAETQNKRLRENLQLSKMQLQNAQKKGTTAAYEGVNARIDTGLPKKNTNKNLRTISTLHAQPGTISASHLVHTYQQSYGRNDYLNELSQLKEEKFELEETINQLKQQIVESNSQVDRLKNELHERELNFEEDLSKLKHQVTHDQKQSLQENIDQIRLQRELKDKINQYTELSHKYNNFTKQHAILKDNHDNLLNEIENFNQQLKQEQQRTNALRTELKQQSHSQREILELREQVNDFKRENEILKESNEKLMNSAFSLEREREYREKEKMLKIQIAQLEATLKSDVQEKGSILDKLTHERHSYDSINSEHRQLQIKYYEIKQKYDDLNEKLKFLNQESSIDFSEIEEALILVKERKASKQKKPEFLNEYEADKADHLKRKLTDMEVQIADTVRELDKTRHLLLTQVKINDDYKKEVNLIQNKMEDNKMEYDRKMLEYAQLLDIRSARIKKLERQLKDIAYGTKQVRVTNNLADMDTGENEAIDEAAYLNAHQIGQLERGQNIFEIHLTRVMLNADSAKALNESEPSLFCTIEFYEHELQTTPIMKGSNLDFNFTSQYIIKIDDFFLYYLQKHSSTVELHQAVGSDYRTLAACSIPFKDLIENNVPRIHGTLKLISILDNSVGNVIGALEYWVRLLMPIDQAFRLYKERTKALGIEIVFF